MKVRHLTLWSPLTVILLAALAGAQTQTQSTHKKKDSKAPAVVKATVPPQPQAPPAPARSNGSLFSEDAANLELSSDFKASRVGDVLFVTVTEANTASVSSSAKNARDAGPLPSAVMSAIPLPASASGVPGVVTALGTRQFTGSGSTGRQSTVTASIAARVTEILPNGDLRIEAHKLLKINKEDETLSLTGVVRRRDLLQDSAIPSSSIADLQVKLNGKGVASENNAPGWLAKILGKLSPF